MKWIQEHTDFVLFIAMCAIFALGYLWGQMNGYKAGFKRGRIAGRKHPAASNSQ